MIIAIVTFEIDKELNYTVLKEKFLETSPIYKDTPGLIRKNYICDTSKNLAGGVYCFDNIENTLPKNVFLGSFRYVPICFWDIP